MTDYTALDFDAIISDALGAVALDDEFDDEDDDLDDLDDLDDDGEEVPEEAVMLFLDSFMRHIGEPVYDPLRGLNGLGERVWVDTPEPATPQALIPTAMTADPDYRLARLDAGAWRRLRFRHDFEYWAASVAVVKHKLEGRDVPFVLNVPQRRLLAAFEDDRCAGRPIRVILLKARQWGGSTLTQIYMAWIQLCHRRNWHSLICGHTRDAALNIRGMYTKLLANYPADDTDEGIKAAFRPFEGAQNIRLITGRDCRVTVGTAENPDGVRGGDYAMAHLSEVAFWGDTPRHSARSFIQAVSGGIALMPYSLIVIESTANGIGNYFHSEWVRSREGLSDKHAVFIPWYDIEYNVDLSADPRAIIATLTERERQLVGRGASLANIAWYRAKARSFETPEMMQAEFPADDIEAFTNSGRNVFSSEAVERLRRACLPPAARGDVAGDVFVADSTGALAVWEHPVRGAAYVVTVDVGGRSAKADWSVVAVLKRGVQPEVVAQWRGHTDHDLLARHAEAVARYYNRALLVPESNTFETADGGAASDANSSTFVLARLAARYPNVYRRRSFDRATNTVGQLIGFHTNRSTKGMIIDGLIEAVREGAYIERDSEACNELATYELLPNGAYAARQGYHDDILMTRAIALHIIATEPAPVIDTNYSQAESW